MKRRDFSLSMLSLPISFLMANKTLAEPPNVPASDTLGTYQALSGILNGSITDVPGIKVGHETLHHKMRGCSVVLIEKGAVVAVDTRNTVGSSELSLLNPINASEEKIYALVLSGGSSYGLATAAGVMRYLKEHHIGSKIAHDYLNFIPVATIMDLAIGYPEVKPNEESAYKACVAAHNMEVVEGNIGAGAGATVGKAFGIAHAMKSGIGSASVQIGTSGIVIGALVVVNALGDVRHPITHKIFAGAREHQDFHNTIKQMQQGYPVKLHNRNSGTIGIIATNAHLSKMQLGKIAQTAQDGLAHSLSPAHTLADSDTLFALSTQIAKNTIDPSIIGAMATQVMASAIIRAVVAAYSIPGLPAYRDFVKF